MQRSRGWCITLNNPTPRDYENLQKLASASRYLVCQLEHAPTTGTPHYQGYVYFDNARTFQSLVRRLPRAHLTIARGTARENRAYCTKAAEEGQPPNELVLETGDIPSPGNNTRVTVENVRDMLREGATYADLTNADSVTVSALRLAQEWLKYNMPERDFKPTVRWYYGPTGSGKTRHAMSWLRSEGTVFTVETPGKFWDGYDGQNGVLFDDFRSTRCEFAHLLRLLDRYPMRVEVKGGSRQLNSRHMAITAPCHPRDIYPGLGEDVAQLLRRIDEVIVLPGLHAQCPTCEWPIWECVCIQAHELIESDSD